MNKWQQKYVISECQKNTEKTLNTPDPHVTNNFIRLVRITAICERALYLDDDTILRELDADDLAELTTLETWDKQNWATLLAHRLLSLIHI